MTGFIIGAVVGSVFGLFIGACCHAAGREDEAMERTLWPDDKRHSGLLEEGEE